MKTFVRDGKVCTNQTVDATISVHDIQGSVEYITKMFDREKTYWLSRIPGIVEVNFQMEPYGHDGAYELCVQLTRQVTDEELAKIAKSVHAKMVKEDEAKAKRKLKYEELKAEFGE